jgi:diguanylate cyclase (GGDEF)-like protein
MHLITVVSRYITVSVGVATFNRDTKLPCNMLIQQADEALYLAKDYGRNQVVAAK